MVELRTRLSLATEACPELVEGGHREILFLSCYPVQNEHCHCESAEGGRGNPAKPSREKPRDLHNRNYKQTPIASCCVTKATNHRHEVAICDHKQMHGIWSQIKSEIKHAVPESSV